MEQDNVVRIFDTTLRDGEQAPGNAMTPEEKLRLARQLDALGVGVIEAGLPPAPDGGVPRGRAAPEAVGRPAPAARGRCPRPANPLGGGAPGPPAPARPPPLLADPALP